MWDRTQAHENLTPTSDTKYDKHATRSDHAVTLRAPRLRLDASPGVVHLAESARSDMGVATGDGSALRIAPRILSPQKKTLVFPVTLMDSLTRTK